MTHNSVRARKTVINEYSMRKQSPMNKGIDKKVQK